MVMLMGDGKDAKSFWASIPGILTGLAALITAIGGIWYGMPGPDINSFEPNQTSIIRGDSATISWSVSNAGSVSINSSNATNARVSIVPGKCSSGNSGTCQVSPEISTKYVITAEKWGKGAKTDNFTIEVLDRPEAIITYYPLNPTVNKEITFDASKSKGQIKQYEWKFDDGEPSFEARVTRNYSHSGTHSVRLSVRNNGLYNSTDISVNIVEPPKASWTFSPKYPKIPQKITFDSSGSKGTRYKWDFDDGEESIERSPTHNFLRGGPYDVNLTVWNDQGHSDSSNKTVSINLILKTDEFLKSEEEEYLVSRNGKYYAIMRENGYIEIYRWDDPDDRFNYNIGRIWYWPPQYPIPNPPCYATVQSDGNFCVYPGSYPEERRGERLWCSEKTGETKDYYAIVKDNGSLCVYEGSGPEDQDADEWNCLSPGDPES
jgi:PKD repeat protein